MTASIAYVERWNALLRKPIGSLTRDEARARDASGELYGVVLGDLAHPDAYLDVVRSKNYIGVWFFDENSLRYLKYEFKKVDDSTMFMSGVVLWEYPPDAKRDFNTATVIHDISYKQDGIVVRVVRDTAAREETVTHTSDVNLDINWEKVPEFGDWDSIARKDRDRPSGLAGGGGEGA